MSTSQADLLRDLIHEYALGRAGTATSSSPTTLVDASDFGGPIPGGVFPVGSPIRITSGVAAGSNTYKQGNIDPDTGTITLSPQVAALTGTPTFIISTAVQHCDRIVEALNRSLQRMCSHQWKVMLTNIVDGDFLGALVGVAIDDNWSEVNAVFGDTGSRYVDLAFPDGYAMRGAAVVSTATNGYIQSASTPAHPSTTRNFFTTMRASGSGTTAQLILMDITNNAVITPTYTIGAATTTSQGFVVAKGNYSVPSTCTQIAWRLNVQESGKTAIFGPLADVEQGQTVFPAPIHLQSEDDVLGWYALGVREVGAILNPGPDTFSYLSWQPDGVKYGDFGWGFGIQFETAPPFPIAMDEYNFFPELTSDADTTPAPPQLVLCGAAVQLYEMLGFGDTTPPTVSRGHIIPTLAVQRLQGAKTKWSSAYMSRLRTSRKVRMRRDFSAGVYA